MNTLTSLFDWLLMASLRASALTLVVLAVQFLLQRYLTPRWRYSLWLPVLAVLLMPVHPESRWSFETAFLSTHQPASQVAAPPVELMAAPGLPMAEPTPAAIPMAVASTMSWHRITVLLWLAGCAVILLAGMLSFSRVLLRFKASRQPVGEKLQALITQTAEEVGLRRAPAVWIAPAISSPAVTGLIRPTLLLPERFDHAFTLSEVRLILQHELTHLKRRDLPVNALLCLLMALHWFNPLLWLAFLKVRTDREAACDAQVLHNAPQTRRIEYGHALLKVESAFSPLSLSLGFVGIFQRGAALRSRIRSIATQQRAHPLMNALAVFCIVLMTFFGITRAESPSFTLGQSAFRKGDSIRIASVLRAPDLLSVSVEYELGSTAEATLSLYITSLTGNSSARYDPRQSIVVRKGRGVATLRHPRPYDGLPHVTLYDTQAHKAIGGIYFGSAAEAEASKKLDLSYMTAVTPAAGGAAFLTNKLNKIILPRVNFANATLEECLTFLRVKSREFDTTTTNEKLKGVPIILRKEDGPEASITLDLKDIPVGEALRYITELASYKYTVAPYAVLVQKASSAPPAASPARPQARPAVIPPGNAGNIILPDVKFRDTTLEDALDFIRVKSREADPAKKGVNIILKKSEVEAVTPRITLDLKDVPLPEAMLYITELASHSLTSDGESYIVAPISH